MGSEILIVVVIAAVLLIAPVAALILAIMAYSRSKRVDELLRRMAKLEARLNAPAGRQPAAAPRLESELAVAQASPQDVGELVTRIDDVQLLPETATAGIAPQSTRTPPAAGAKGPESPEPFGWETFIGQKAFGWVAVLLFVFAAAFFLRYAYQNNWIGPVGRVAIGELVGLSLMLGGWRYFREGWSRFSQMLTAAGIVVLYLSTYSAFGFYQLLPQQHAGIFLGALVLESMIAAVVYRSMVVALVAVVGGLLTPLLMQADHDSYSALFTYLAVLNAGVVLALLLRSWCAVGSVAYLGTQWLFWMWYSENYHPEKLAWTLGFQIVLFGLYLAHTALATRLSPQKSGREELVRVVLNAVLGFIAFRTLTRDDYSVWLGTEAVGMATLYALAARATLAWRPSDNRLLLTLLAVSVGFAAWALPLQAGALWVSLGWAAMGLALWWFGLRISAPPLRIMAGVLGAAAVARVLILELPRYTRDPFVPIFNSFALPSIGVAACVMTAVVLSDSFQPRLKQIEKTLIGVAGVTGVLLLWVVLSYDCYGYFDSQTIGSSDVAVWRWRGQLALTVMWTVFATALLVLGFKLGRARLRWLGMALYGVSVIKLFVVDMANVQQLYRILAFFVLAVVLGLVAKTYQRFK